ncbi:hypothetical protein ACFW0I_33330 [[Kitasatospora] papulosa]|uniref:hypothetical protein n=1 Tax=[Kitasatospora] papulosa TaxID=1464011 RepID=UPI0036804FD1
MKSRKLAVLAACAVVALTSGCGAAGGDPQAHEASRTALHASRVKDYNTFAELKQDSVAVVKVTATGSAERSLSSVPTTVTTVAVDDVLWGNSPAQSLSIQQLGRSNMDLEDTGAILEKGQQYILFVEPFHMTPGDDTGLYQITGGQGVYRLNKAGSDYMFAGGGKPKLPKQFVASAAGDVAKN